MAADTIPEEKVFYECARIFAQIIADSIAESVGEKLQTLLDEDWRQRSTERAYGDQPGKMMLTPTEAGKLLRLGKNAIYQAIHARQIPSVHVGDRYLIPRLALEKLIREGSGKSSDDQKKV